MDSYENERLEGVKEYQRLANEQGRVDSAMFRIKENADLTSRIFFDQQKIANPFYDNHLFSEEDLRRATFSKWSWLWLWIYPTFTQVADGYAFHYKIVDGAYWFIKSERITPLLSNETGV